MAMTTMAPTVTEVVIRTGITTEKTTWNMSTFKSWRGAGAEVLRDPGQLVVEAGLSLVRIGICMRAIRRKMGIVTGVKDDVPLPGIILHRGIIPLPDRIPSSRNMALSWRKP